MAETLRNFYINRNVQVLRDFYSLRDEGVKVLAAQRKVAQETEGVSATLVNSLIYDKDYPYSQEARKIVKKEREDNSPQRKIEFSAT